jgi:polysaccharide export outer membrane protein
MVVYVTGRVNNPNRFPVNTNVTVLQAISTAGGLNPFAKQNKIKIFRQEGDKTRVFLFKYDEVVDGKNLEQNIALKRGDVIVVP